MHQMGYTSCKADPDLWFKAETRSGDIFSLYANILCYVDDISCVHHDPMTVLDKINGYMPLKPPLVGNPDKYLGAKLRKTQLANGIWAWGLVIPNMQHKLSRIVKSIQPTNCTILFNYPHELTTHSLMTLVLNETYLTPLNQSVMRWMVELGCIDIATKVSLLLSHLAYPYKGHLKIALHIMAYLWQKHNTQLTCL
jgi:hypothetical protein